MHSNLCFSNISKLGRVARLMAMGFSTPNSRHWRSRRLLGSITTPPYVFYNPRRRYLHSQQSTSNSSSSNTNFTSTQFQTSNMDDPIPWVDETAWVGYLEPGVSVNQSSASSSPLPPMSSNHQTSIRSGYRTSIYSTWTQETIRMKQLKLKTRHGTENIAVVSMGSEDGSDSMGKCVYSSSTYTSMSENMDFDEQCLKVCQTQFETSRGESPFINGGSARRLSSETVHHSGTMYTPLKHDAINHIQSNGINRQNMDKAEHDPPFKSETNSGHLIIPQANLDHRKNLSRIYDDILVVDNVLSAKKVVGLLTTRYRDLVHACDTEVAKIDVKKETPVDHGEIICFSIYSGSKTDFGDGKSCVWVDVLDGGRELLMEFAPFFEDSSIRKVWHNYSFDSHVIENYGIKVSGFHADTMHMARLWDSSRRNVGGYSLEALTSNKKVMDGVPISNSDVKDEGQYSINRELIGKVSMKTIFGMKKLRGDGSEGKIATVAPVEELQRKERELWICYSALDSMSTLGLFESLQSKLEKMDWFISGESEAEGSMYEFYEKYWKPFGELLVKMETEGMLVDRSYLWEIQEIATREQHIAANRFRQWAAKYCLDAIHMNVGSDIQLRHFFFGGTVNRMDQNQALPKTRSFRVPNTYKVLENGKQSPSKFHNITLSCLGVTMETDMYTVSGWPSVSGAALKALAGKVSSEYDWIDDAHGFESDIDNYWLDNDTDVSSYPKREEDVSSYGTAYKAFGENKEGKEACHAIAALCELRSIDSLISNFILPLQNNHISGKSGRIHCSLNINTETGRLSARRPNLQNQPALEKDRYKIRQAFIAAPGNSLIVADYGQLELRILAHLADCKSMKDAFKSGGDFHSRTALNMYSHIREAVTKQEVLLEWHPHPGEKKPPVPLLKDAFASERRKAKMLNFSIAYGKTPFGLARDWKVPLEEAEATVNLWYQDRKEVLNWQENRKREANKFRCVQTLLGRTRSFPSLRGASNSDRRHIERAAINTPVQGSAADVAMCAMLEISRNARLNDLEWKLLLQVHDEVILEGPTESAEEAKALVVECMSKPFDGTNILSVDLAVDAKCAQNWYAAK